ncbi:MAG: ATP-dependent helicase, partial [Anaerolineales bacterium]|nr:ATP-dependent helicase [Anaerolineales bacterium]
MITGTKPRPSQSKILTYRKGKMGISAVPGSGKTWTLSRLAADIIVRGDLSEDQEVLIVTLVNSAVDNFSIRISDFIKAKGLLPHIGYRVRTLHGLAHDIVREKPEKVGLDERFQIIDDREAEIIRKETAHAWLQSPPNFLEDYLLSDMDDNKRDWVRRQQLPELVNNLALSFIRSAKDRRLAPQDLRQELDHQPAPLPLAEMGWEIYTNYQRALTYRGAVDFDDLIRLALDLLEIDTEYLERLRFRWPFILEDEAQDSSLLQEQILRLLAGEKGNWVRVGDPNQAIFETFTTANPKHLLTFIRQEADSYKELPSSGRSQPSIINIANYFIKWVNNEHPEPTIRDALTIPFIKPVPDSDPQPNPSNDPAGIHFISRKHTPDEEIQAVVDSIKKW